MLIVFVVSTAEGITPRVARVAPGQAVVFAVYEKMKRWIDEMKSDIKNSDFTEH
jgi:solute carrier family 25 citrate transporter 1